MGAIMFCDILLISPNDISREGLSHILNSEQFNIFGYFNSVSDIVDTELPLGILVVVDFSESDQQEDSIQLLRRLYPSLKIVVLSDHFELRTVINCFNAGAHGYMIKTMKSLPLIMALRLAALGEKVLPSDLVDALGRQPMDSQTADENEHDIEDVKLTPRESNVLCCLITGYSNKVIARHLDVCEATVKAHVKAILRKLNVQNRTQAAIWASSRKLMGPCLS
jgi:two-component system, NarL family, nitrate/nitrite response regulator NarL